MKAKKYVVQYYYERWKRSHNDGADGKYSKAEATRIAKFQEEHVTMAGLKYRIKESK